MTDNLFHADNITLAYTYPGDKDHPEKVYHVSNEAIQSVLDRCSDESIVKVSVQFDLLRYIFQTVIGQRGLAQQVDAEARRYFYVGGLDPEQFSSVGRPVSAEQLAGEDFDL